MSRIHSVAASALGVNRRTVLAAAGAVSLSAGVGYALHPTDSQAATAEPAAGSAAPAAARPFADKSRQTAATSPTPYTQGTTVASVAAPRGGSGYRRLGDGPGWKRVVRGELAAPRPTRVVRRTALAAFVQFTDLHLTDVQHPLRLEYLRAYDQHAWRPQEALTVPGAISLVERINALRGAPVTGAPLRFVMTTGDNTDNNARSELEWFMKVMSGGRITPNSGDPQHYEGVQNSGLTLYWQPGSATRDHDKALGFPNLEGFLAAAIREVRSPGLHLPWYSTVGNHDALPLGCYGSHGDPYLTEAAIKGKKLCDAPVADARKLRAAIKKATDPEGTGYRDFLKAHTRSMRTVTADEKRAPYTQADYLKAHLDPAHQGHGPFGHGYSTANLDAGTQYYSFRISDDVIGISLDTTDPGGHYQGSIGTAQLEWLDRTLGHDKHSYAVVFSHHTSKTMTNTRPDPARPKERRHGGAEVVSVLSSHSNVLAWVNGHIHKNAITPHRASSGGSFWEISTASHIDFPQLARVIELVDNKDGTISLFTTLVESAAPHRTDYADLTQTGLAALYRELSYNAPGRIVSFVGTEADRNTELVLKKHR
ncbi:TIGR03767 family metallophosphoesterase [Streptomyces pluripotens]|uniref:TIGR03767 family metallophosphoesterase n=1 Tax=Streptomyces pluripotens TaxID=1355015 RepID=A0A221NWZ8_9ACTN|nr:MULTISPECIES: TIGR03767 family metallophosphoesterase [Streptomyces]ARP70238.1 metallophosphoesterase [Streptomyces pluripotens]ASN24497.1 TIGR03767 family metallophosphoesterase [Streptomyces pluripotens]KIE28023.1 metallophosphoesterase [Streptomyces sp. MUSC 125]MCH0558332.1 TIGR03767 family metallophosphoesterase [Streptomyces sp. MUM 16J]